MSSWFTEKEYCKIKNNIGNNLVLPDPQTYRIEIQNGKKRKHYTRDSQLNKSLSKNRSIHSKLKNYHKVMYQVIIYK